VRAAARVAGTDAAASLTAEERAALDGRANPTGVVVPPPR
jgi:hypothetical protein